MRDIAFIGLGLEKEPRRYAFGRGRTEDFIPALPCSNHPGSAGTTMTIVLMERGDTMSNPKFKDTNRECNIRKWFVEHDLINGVILLPDNLFYNTSATGIIIGPP